MKNRTPPPRDQRPPLPDFTPVPLRYRHDGWTPERQRAFIEALADTGSITRAARMVNMTAEGVYYIRRQPGAESFRRAYDAALDFGVLRLKDEAFERAMEGELIPVFVAGKLMGFRRKRNDKLLMFLLRHYGQDAEGRRVTIDYFSSRAGAKASAKGQGQGDAEAAATAEARTTTVKTVISGRGGRQGGAARTDQSAALLQQFEGVPLDEEAQAAIRAALTACAERRRLEPPEENPAEPFIRVGPKDNPFLGELVPSVEVEEWVPFVEGEEHWESLGREEGEADMA